MTPSFPYASAGGSPVIESGAPGPHGNDPARCGLGWDVGGARLEIGDADVRLLSRGRVSEAREAIASYLAGHGAAITPDCVVSRAFPPRGAAGGRAALRPRRRGARSQCRTARSGRLRSVRCGATAWCSTSGGKSTAARSGARCRPMRVIVVGNPADPTGAELSRDELSFLARVCEAKQFVLSRGRIVPRLTAGAWSECCKGYEVRRDPPGGSRRRLRSTGSRIGVARCGGPRWIGAAPCIAPGFDGGRRSREHGAMWPSSRVAGTSRGLSVAPTRAAHQESLHARATASLRESPWTITMVPDA